MTGDEEVSEAELAGMRAAAKAWAETSGDWSPEQWRAINAVLGPAVERAKKKTSRKRKTTGPQTRNT